MLEVAHGFLEEGGYHVISTSDIAKALEIVRDREDPIHLLATDVVMPGMSGCELAERAFAELETELGRLDPELASLAQRA